MKKETKKRLIISGLVVLGCAGVGFALGRCAKEQNNRKKSIGVKSQMNRQTLKSAINNNEVFNELRSIRETKQYSDSQIKAMSTEELNGLIKKLGNTYDNLKGVMKSKVGLSEENFNAVYNKSVELGLTARKAKQELNNRRKA